MNLVPGHGSEPRQASPRRLTPRPCCCRYNVPTARRLALPEVTAEVFETLVGEPHYIVAGPEVGCVCGGGGRP